MKFKDCFALLHHRFIGDAALNLLAYAVPLVVLQIILLPLLATKVDAEYNGLILSLISLFSLVPATLGNALNNIRLIDQSDDIDESDDNSFRYVLIFSLVVDAFVIAILSFLYTNEFNISILFMVVTATLLLMQEYLKVAYRIQLNYRAIAVSSCLLSVGYMCGYGLFLLFGEWSLIYLCGQLLSTIYVLMTTRLWRGSVSRGPLYRKIVKDYGILLGSSIIGRLVTYADRLLLYPLLGGASVTIYYCSTLLGKMLSIVITPMNSVMLSYLAKLKAKPSRLFHIMLMMLFIICVFAYIVTMFISRPILQLIYPQYANQSIKLVWVTTASSYCGVAAAVVNPFVLKFTSLKNQITVNALYLIIYVSLSICLLKLYGLIGFCFGSLAASVIKLTFLILAYEHIDDSNR